MCCSDASTQGKLLRLFICRTRWTRSWASFSTDMDVLSRQFFSSLCRESNPDSGRVQSVNSSWYRVMPNQNSLFKQVAKYQDKGKVVLLQAWSGPEGSRKLRFPDFMTTAQGDGKVVSLTHRPHLTPGNSPGTHFC